MANFFVHFDLAQASSHDGKAICLCDDTPLMASLLFLDLVLSDSILPVNTKSPHIINVYP